MQLKKSLLTMICTLAVIILCSVNTTYAWESLDQSALNITAGEAAQVEPDDPDKPDKPDQPDESDKPSDSDKPEKDPESSGKPQEPQKDPESSAAQTGKADADTGDTHQFLLYMALMLLSFILLIAIGVSLILLSINAIEKRRS